MIRYVIRYKTYTTNHSASRFSSILYDSFNPDTYPILSGSCSVEVNSSGSLSLSIPVNNPELINLKELVTWMILVVTAFKNDADGNATETVIDECIPFVGRILKIDTDAYGNASIECEGLFNALNDIKVVGYSFLSQSSSLYPFESVGNVLHSLISDYWGAKITGSELFPLLVRDSPIQDGGQYYEEVLPSNVNMYTDRDSTNGIGDILLNLIINKHGGFFYITIEFNEGLIDPRISYERGSSNPLNYNADATEYILIHPGEYDGYSHHSEDPGNSSLDEQGDEPEVPDQGGQDLSEIDLDYNMCTSPEFIYGYNIVSVTKTKASDKIITGIVPFGSDFSLATDGPYDPNYQYTVPTRVADEFNSRYEDKYRMGLLPYYIIDEELADKYGVHLEAKTWSDLKLDSESPTRLEVYDAISNLVYNNVIPWMEEYLKDLSDTYTIVGLEPIEYGKNDKLMGNSNYLVRLMYGVRYCDPNKNVRAILPCLGIKYDLVNHANNEYTIGPLIPESYNETNISNS